MIGREQARALVDHPWFQRFILGVIVVNAISLGLETSAVVTGAVGGLLRAADRLALVIFVVELVLRLYAYGWRFFSSRWNVFDFVVVAIALVPAAGPLVVLRALRVLRVLRLMSAVPSMRRVVTGLLSAVPGLAAVTVLLTLIVYVAAVIATGAFRDAAPEYFDDLGTSLFTLFQTMTGEAWPDVAAAVMDDEPTAWIFFVIFIVVSTFAVLNLFIAVIVGGMESGFSDEMLAMEEEHAAEQAASDQLLRQEIQALRAELEELRANHHR